jgi:hypothetical protein
MEYIPWQKRSPSYLLQLLVHLLLFPAGHDVPGEGELKIMEYIPWQKRSPSYPL